MAVMHDASPAMVHLLRLSCHGRAASAALLLTQATVIPATADGPLGAGAPAASVAHYLHLAVLPEQGLGV